MAFFRDVETGAQVDSGGPRFLPAYDAPRPIVGAGQRLNLSKRGGERVDKRDAAEWQKAAWRFFEQIGEVHYAFNLIGQVCSRVRLYPAIVAAANETPVHVDQWLENMADKGNTDRARRVGDIAKDLVADLTENTRGRTSGLMRTMAMNFGVPGEVYLAHNKKGSEWLVCSTEEISPQNNQWRIRRSRQQGGAGVGKDIMLPGDAYVARLWRTHPRYTDEPDSSMLGVLDQCEQLVLLDQAMRAMARRAMNAGLVFIPNGITAFSSEDKEDSIADSIAASALQAVESEAALSTVTPKVLTGPPELGNFIKWIELTKAVDPNLAAAAQKLLERILVGIDIPKDVVKGLAEVKFANAIVIDDDLYRAHIEPLVLLIVDALTEVYLQPLLLKGLSDEADQKIAKRMVMWADTSSIVTRPDKSQAANEGYDKMLLSATAWRQSRGFSETDAPKPDELIRRLAIEKASIPPEMATVMLHSIDPEFFDTAAAANAEESGIPNDVSALLDEQPGEAPQEPAAADRTRTPMESAQGPLQGGEITPGGNLPPVPAR
jgi:hypothetical protein